MAAKSPRGSVETKQTTSKVAVPGADRLNQTTGFVHLHNHSHYSLLDGLQKVPEMLDRVKALGMSAVALTDHGNLSGAIEFYKEAKSRGIKPIIGVEAYVAPRGHTDKTAKVDANPYHLILLAENNQGYQNLMRLVSIAHLDGFYYKPRVDRELLAKYSEGLIALSGCAGGEVATHITSGNLDQAEEVVRWYLETFGRDYYFLELQDHAHQWQLQQQINTGLFELAKRTGAQLVVTADSHYSVPGDKEPHEILLCVQTGKTIGDTDRMTMDMELYVSNPVDIATRWQDRPEVMANTALIAERCQVELDLGKILIPRFPVPDNSSERDYLHRLAWQGLVWRYCDIAKEDVSLVTEAQARQQLSTQVVERADFELGVINKMGFDGYFLIVADFINWGKNRGIIFGPGRGSAAGSIVSYALNITDLDPLKYDLLFERFLNPDRISMPDIDIDIQDSRREEVISYVAEKYGQDRVAQIITFGTMAARNAVRDTGRVLGMTYGEVDAIAKLVPQPIQGRHIPLACSSGIIKSTKPEHQPNPELMREYKSNSRAKRLIDTAVRLEGTIRSNGVHAAGVVIAPEEIVKYTPLQRAQKGGIATQYSMGPIEELGLLKMDFLGLSNLTIINNALRIVKKVYNQKIDIADIPLDDAKTFELFARGETTGVFQFESAGMKRYLRELKPTKLDDIIAMAALYRPGPMQWIDDFVNRKHGRTQITYFHSKMENALANTYGILVYQEQVMQIAKEMCGFTGGQADTLRKGVAKKKPEVMAKLKNDFIEGAIKTSGVQRDVAEKFWLSLEAFAAYCFPKAHAACYALIAYQTAYLKTNFPAAYMAALMTSDHDNIERIAIEVAECRRMGIEVLPPDVNESYLEFGVVPDTGAIRFGLAAIKNVGVGPIEAILSARSEGGRFTSVEDFAKRVSAADVNKKAWESLIKAGAMDCLGDRAQLLANVEIVTGYASKAQKSALSGQIDIFGSMGSGDDLPALRLDQAAAPLTTRQQLAWEKELLGLYLSHHPLDDYDNWLHDKVKPLESLTVGMEGQSVQVGGIITMLRKFVTKNNATMAFAGLEDKTGATELIVFPKVYEKTGDKLALDQVVMVTGKVSTKNRDGKATHEIKILADKIEVIDYDRAMSHQPKARPAEEPVPAASSTPAVSSAVVTRKVVLNLPNASDQALLLQLKSTLSGHAGSEPVYALLGPSSQKILLPFKVSATPELLQQLSSLVGATNVNVQ
jgi:DNA polymerase III subunit alpha